MTCFPSPFSNLAQAWEYLPCCSSGRTRSKPVDLYRTTFLSAPSPPMTTYFSPRSIPQLSLEIRVRKMRVRRMIHSHWSRSVMGTFCRENFQQQHINWPFCAWAVYDAITTQWKPKNCLIFFFLLIRQSTVSNWSGPMRVHHSEKIFLLTWLATSGRSWLPRLPRLVRLTQLSGETKV